MAVGTPEERQAIAENEPAESEQTAAPAPSPAPKPEAEAAEEKKAPPVGVVPGRRNLDDIYASREEELTDELQEGDEDTLAAQQSEAGEAVAPAAAPAAAAPGGNAPSGDAVTPPASAPAANPSQPVPADFNLDGFYKIKVGGQEVTVRGDALVRLAQKGQSADQTFQAAARMRDEAAARQPAQDAATSAASKPVATPSTEGDLDEGEIVKAIQLGSEDEAKAAIRKVIDAARKGANTATPEQIIDQAVQKVNFQRALETFGSEFKDVLTDPNLTVLAVQHVHAIRKRNATNGVDASDLDVFREAGGRVKEWVGKFAPAAPAAPPANPTPAPVSLEARRETKRTTQQPIRPASARTQSASTPQARDDSAYVQQMRKSRGQAVA